MRRSATRSSEGPRLPRRVVLLAALTAPTLVLAACSGTGGSDSDKPPVTIGISLSLTGDRADPGKAAKRGYDLWAETSNDKNGLLGRQIQLKIIDDKSEPDLAAANYEKLITKDKVDLVLGPYSSLLTIPSSQVAAKHGYAFIEPAGGSPKVFAQKLGNLFFVQPAPIVEQGAVFANYILSLPKDKRPKTAAYPTLDDPFSLPISAHVRKLFEDAGIKTVFETTYAPDADLGPVIAKVAAAKPDVLVAASQSEDGYAAVRALVAQKFAPKWLYVANGANSPVEFPVKVGRENVNGIFSSGDWFPSSNASGSAAFVGAYLKKYGGAAEEIDNNAVEAYSAGLLLNQVAEKTGKIDNATIIKTLHSGTWRTPVGDLSWDAYGAPEGSYILFQWIDGKLQSVYPPGRAQHQPITTPLPWSGTPAP